VKTCSEMHDRRYKVLKDEGQPGWDPCEVCEKFRRSLEDSLRPAYVPKRGRLLELGCGAGNITVWLAEKGYEACGVDIAPTAIEWAVQRAEKHGVSVDFRVGSVLDLHDFPDGYFEVVLDGHCFHCIIGDDRPVFLKNALRILRPGGVFLVNTMCGETMAAQCDPISRCVFVGDVATRYIGLPESILDEIRAAGFEIISSNVVNDEDSQDLLVTATRR
jgi:ubiquinone/menaquinone biosynthesis C-methylase UbiE